jgi:hypothetical protein
MEQFRTHFRNIESTYNVIPHRDKSLICKQGFYGSCPVLKLQKPAWTNDDMKSIPNQTGVFFSIWIDEKSAARRQANYNIHALKMRQLKNYKVTSIDFAKNFRKRFKPLQRDWPHVSVDYGPLTLMQGWLPIVADQFEDDCLGLMNRFGVISPIIDDLLACRRIGC